MRIRVGGASADFDNAKEFVRRYLNSPSEHWSYPLYDGYPGGPTDELSPQDLLGPALLNAGIRDLRSFDEFIACMPAVNDVLRQIAPDATVGDPDARSCVVEIIGLLDVPGIHGVGLTRFSKVLHRKRPGVFPLYDLHVQRCYQVISAPGLTVAVPSVRRRSRRAFAAVWLEAVAVDVVEQASAWGALAQLAPVDGPRITPLRALDIVAWGLGQPAVGERPARSTWDRVVARGRAEVALEG